MSGTCPEVHDPRFRALQLELQMLNQQIRRLNDLLSPDIFDMKVVELDKSSTFTDTEVLCQGATLIQISTDGDLSDVSYKIGKKSEISHEAAESPHILGPITSLFVTNDTAEDGKTIRIAKYRISPLVAAAIHHGTPQKPSPPGKLTAWETFAASAARTANGNTQATPIDLSLYDWMLLFLDITAVSGTTPTLDVYVDFKDPLTGKWVNQDKFAQKTSTGTSALALNCYGKDYSVRWVLGGTNPSFTFSVSVVAKG